MALIEVSSSISQLDASTFLSEGFELSSQAIIPSEEFSGSFIEGVNNIEFYVYNAQNKIEYADYNFIDYKITDNSNPNTPGTNMIDITPEKDVIDKGYSNGKLTAFYNFVNHELSSSIDNTYYISEISSDRTEIRLKSNFISNDDIQISFINFEQQLQSSEYFDEFYISFGNNENHIGINTKIDIANLTEVDSQTSILIKLYDGLPLQYKVEDQIYIFTKTAESLAYQIEFEETINIPNDTIQLRGPNTNLEIKDFTNASSTYKNKDELLNTNSSASKDELINVLNRKGIQLTPNYSSASFNEFVNFSSAKSRVNNFITKVTNIQSYENDIRLLNATTGSNSTPVSSSISSLWTKIEEEIKNFDGYEYYQYYNTGSDAYPKTGSIYPYELLDVNDVEVKTWLGSDDSLNSYYGGMIYSASLYDENNENWLYYTIPTFITEQNNNDNYVDFCNMVGQSFDELWLYTKAVTEKLNTTNQLDKGVPLSLADDVITSLGYTGFGNNYNNQDNFIGLIGNDDGSYVPPTGSELITNYIAINKGTITNYWEDNYSWDNYVEQLITAGFPYPIDRVSKEIFKRLYHNMAYLVKKKGTIAGLRQLINIWGIPSTILRINEFGGKNKDETDDYDLWYQRYSYAYTPVGNSYRASASAVVPWMPLERNYIAETEYIVPDGVGFRFKTTGFPSSSYAGSYDSQSLAVKKSNGLDDRTFDWGIALFYTGSTSGSYSGSSNSDYYNYGELKFFMSASTADGGIVESDPIYLPFFDKGWWTVLLQRDNHSNDDLAITTYTLYVKNKLYDGWDGNSIGFQGSASISNYDTSQGLVYGTGLYGTGLYGGYISESLNHGWNKFGVNEVDGVYIGGRLGGARVGPETGPPAGFITNKSGYGFSGSFQEFRYYSNAISESIFNDFVMNPESIEGVNITGSKSSFDIVNFRAPLGNELENYFTASQLTQYTESILSSHPAITASAFEYITGSFINPANNTITSSYYVQYETNEVKRTYSKQNIETYFLDQPSIGIRNRISNKIQATSNLNFGTVLSDVVSIQKDPFISQSYTENINALEVAFSPQDEINDDIIQTLGYGAIQSAIADPRFRSQSALTYPQLDKIADDYFRKYVGSDIFDYLRLIKYFDDSLFKAIKNYVPARTSISTGVVIKQNMLERNRYREPQVDMVTTQSYAIQNIPLTTKNLELTGSIEVIDITGSAGGSVNEYNITGSQSGYYSFRRISGGTIPAGGYLNLNKVVSTPDIGTPTNPHGNLFGDGSNDFGIDPNSDYLQTNQPIQAHLAIYAETNAITSIDLIVSSSERGELSRGVVSNGSTGGSLITPLLDIIPGEKIGFFAFNSGNSLSSVNLAELVVKTYEYTNPPPLTTQSPSGDISSSAKPSTQAYLEKNITISGSIYSVNSFQEEFYDGEYSGSSIKSLPTQSNPYKSVLPSSTQSYNAEVFTDLTNVSQVGSYFSNFGAASFDFDTTSVPGTSYAALKYITDIEIVPFQTYQVSYKTTITTNPGVGQTVGILGDNYDPSSPYTTYLLASPTGVPASSLVDYSTAVSFSFQFTPPNVDSLWDNLNKKYSLGFEAYGGIAGDISQINIKGVGGIYEETKALIPWNLNVINNYNPLTSGSFDIWNTQSLIFENSDYNPLNNNISHSRTSSHRYVLDFLNDPYPENRQTIIDIMYNPLSASSPTLVAERATNPDSNYTSLAALSPTYKGTKLQSLTYNTFTPSGSVRKINSLPNQPYNKGRVGVSSSVAVEFLDGTTGSWGGDNSFGQTSVIDQYPRYIARFDRSFEQFNKYDSREFTISSLISVSMDFQKAIIQPESLDIDGSNEYKKPVSTTFSPNRKMAVSFDSVDSTNTNVINLETIQIGNYDLLGGSIQFLTINSNAKSKNASSTAYFYTLGDSNVAQKVYTGQISGSIPKEDFMESGSNNNSSAVNNKVALVSSMTAGSGVGGYVRIYVDVTGGAFSKIELYPDAGVTMGDSSTSARAQNYTDGEIISISQADLVANGWTNNLGDLVFSISQPQILDSSTPNIPQARDAIQMVTASQVTLDGQQYGFLLSGSDTTGSTGTFLLPFSEDQPKAGFSGLPDSSKLSIGGPQLAVFHAYNQLVASQSVRPAFYCNQTSHSSAWVLEGLDPSNEDNYYQWYPSASDCAFYEDNKQAYLIDRGDVLRVEGIKTLLSPDVLDLTSSIEFIEDFTVEEIQDYYYTSSVFSAGPGSLIVGTGFLSNDVWGSPLSGFPFETGFTSVITKTISDSGGSYQFTTGGSGTGGVITVTSILGRSNTNKTSILYTSFSITTTGAGYAVGDVITIPSNFFADPLNFNATSPSAVSLRLTSANVVTAGLGNPFTAYLNYNPGCSAPYIEAPLQTFSRGEIGFTLPTFIKTDRNPSEVLLGVKAGEITKFTIRRQIENERKVITKNTRTTLGSKGYLTQTGGGFLLPTDLSDTQKKNALNLINELRSKNAFPGSNNTSATNNTKPLD
jgi:hypothetical protein